VVRRPAKRGGLLDEPAGADAELEPAVRQHIEGGGLLRERERIRRGERDDRRPEPNALGDRSGEAKAAHRVAPFGRRVPWRPSVGAVRVTALEPGGDDGVRRRPERVVAERLDAARDRDHVRPRRAPGKREDASDAHGATIEQE
jgi:hypothetical protein